MSFAMVDYHKSKWNMTMKVNSMMGETNILIPRVNKNASLRFAKKINKVMTKEKKATVILNNDLMKNEQFCENILDAKKYIITGKRLYKVLIERVLKDVSKQMNVELSKLSVALLIKEYSWDNIDLIKNISRIVRTLTILTDDKAKFMTLSKELFDKQGIALRIVDKNKTNLKYVKVIVNIDYTSEELNKINYWANAIIVCGLAKEFKVKRKFNGIVIRKIDIISNEDDKEGFDNMALCEAKIYNCLRKLRENDRIFEREGYRINGYIGENGKLSINDFEGIGKIFLDKS